MLLQRRGLNLSPDNPASNGPKLEQMADRRPRSWGPPETRALLTLLSPSLSRSVSYSLSRSLSRSRALHLPERAGDLSFRENYSTFRPCVPTLSVDWSCARLSMSRCPSLGRYALRKMRAESRGRGEQSPVSGRPAAKRARREEGLWQNSHHESRKATVARKKRRPSMSGHLLPPLAPLLDPLVA